MASGISLRSGSSPIHRRLLFFLAACFSFWLNSTLWILAAGIGGVKARAIISDCEVVLTGSAYQEALDYVYSFVDFERTPRRSMGYDLRSITELLSLLGNPHLGPRTVHVAGSKGKGSTSAIIASALIAAGYRTGLYTSPHLISFRERFQINGSLITEEDFSNLVNEIKPLIEEVNRKAAYGTLSTFEIITAMAFLYFARKDVDFQVVEVGLGGRLDATNVVSPEVSVITNISLEHTDVLGKTLPEIALEKAGIIKAGTPVVSAPQQPAVEMVLQEVAREKAVRLVELSRDVEYRLLDHGSTGQRVMVKGRLDSYEVDIPLCGIWQAENVGCAVAALEMLEDRGFFISREDILDGASSVSWPGRFQIISKNPLVIVDGAHSPYSAHLLKLSLESYFPKKGRAFLIFGCSSDKDIGAMARELNPYFDYVFVTRSRHPRAMSPEIIGREFSGTAIEETSSVTDALMRSLFLADEDDLVCVAGSLYVVGEALEAAKAMGLFRTG